MKKFNICSPLRVSYNKRLIMKTTRNFLNIFDSVLSIILCANVGEKLNERVNVSVGRGSRHRTLGCDVRSAGHSHVHTEE